MHQVAKKPFVIPEVLDEREHGGIGNDASEFFDALDYADDNGSATAVRCLSATRLTECVLQSRPSLYLQMIRLKPLVLVSIYVISLGSIF